jgi:ribosomal protein L21E
MIEFSEGDRVRVDIPDETDVDHQQYHGQHGTIVSTLSDDVDEIIEDEQDARLYRVEFESGQTMDFRRRDLRPPIE